MHIHRLDIDNRHEVEQFVRFPFELYRGDPQWVPPLLSDERLVLDRVRFPFYRHSTAAFFVAEREGRVAGRIAVANNRNYNRYVGTKVAFFNLFEAVQDSQVAGALFQAAFEWAREEGLDTILGPKGSLHLGGRGLLIEGFEYSPAMGIAFHPLYYRQMVKDAGFVKYTDYCSGHLHVGYELPERVFRVAERVKARRGLWIKQFKDKDEMRLWAPRFRRLYNQSFEGVPLFYPVEEDEMEQMTEALLSLTFPKLVKMVMKGEETIGFLLSYPNIGSGLRKAKGRLWPLGWLFLLWDRHRTRWLDINGMGILPSHRGVGATTVMFAELEKTVRASNYQHANLVQISDLNEKSMREMEGLGVKWNIRHRVYQRSL